MDKGEEPTEGTYCRMDLFSFEMENLERKQCGMLNVECGANNSSLDNSQSALADNPKFKTQNSEFRSPQQTVMFMGSSEKVLDLIVKRAAEVYPHLKVVTYSPPYKPEFSEEDNKAIIDAINAADPDLLWIGMTAPKQEKWTYSHWDELNIHCHVGTIGAVFDFFASTVERAPVWWQRHGLEWLYRLLKEPKRMWRRYIIGNALFLFNVIFRERW